MSKFVTIFTSPRKNNWCSGGMPNRKENMFWSTHTVIITYLSPQCFSCFSCSDVWRSDCRFEAFLVRSNPFRQNRFTRQEGDAQSHLWGSRETSWTMPLSGSRIWSLQPVWKRALVDHGLADSKGSCAEVPSLHNSNQSPCQSLHMQTSSHSLPNSTQVCSPVAQNVRYIFFGFP